MLILLLSGKQGSGKSTLANFLVHHFNFTKVSFATTLKQICHELYGTNVPRQVYIDVGQALRGVNKNTWVNQAIKQIESIYYDSIEMKDKFVIDDFRFPNEYKVMLDAYGKDSVYPIRIIRPVELRQLAPKYTPEAEKDISETALDNFSKWHAVINNNTNSSGLFFTTALSTLSDILEKHGVFNIDY